MSLKLAQGFSFFKGGGLFEEKKSDLPLKPQFSPSLKIQTDKEVYRPGDLVTATIEICNPGDLSGDSRSQQLGNGVCSLLVDSLSFEVRGIEKVDPQWFSTPKPLPGSKQKRGEHLFLDCTTPSILSKVIVSSGCTKSYIIRAELPKILPPSYKGTSIRYIYYIKSTLCGRWLVLENGHSDKGCLDDSIQLEARVPLQLWVTHNNSTLLKEGGISEATDQMEIFWKEKDGDSEWVRVYDFSDGFEEGYESSRDEVSSVSSYNPSKGNYGPALRKSLSMQSVASRLSTSDAQYSHGDHSKVPAYLPLARLSVSEVVDDDGSGTMSNQKMLMHSPSAISQSQPKSVPTSPFPIDDKGSPYATGSHESAASEGFIRGRSYNIRIDDQVLLRFSPRNSDSTYYFGDMIGGALTFFHGGSRRCLEVSVTLEISETIKQHFVHPSRRSSPTITKIQSDHHEVVADLVQSSFLFSIPVDGPMSFATPCVSVQWLLRFEFFTTPKGANLNKYEHPLLIEQREKGDWVLPLTVCAPPLRAQHARAENSLSPGNLFHT